MKWNEATNEYIAGVKNYLIRRYGKIDLGWELLIKLLGDNIQQYQNVTESIEKNGIFTGVNKNPLLSTLKDLQAVIMKQIQHFGISPYAEAKIKTTPEDDTEDFLDALTESNNE